MQEYTHLVFGGFISALVAHFLYGVPVDLTRLSCPLKSSQRAHRSLFKAKSSEYCPTLTCYSRVISPSLRLNPPHLHVHSLCAGLAYAFFIYFVQPQYSVTLSAVCVFSHWQIDALNPSGVRTIGLYPSFFWKRRCDFRLAKIRYNNHLANFTLCAACVGILVGMSSL